MKLTSRQFLTQLESSKLRLAFVGMSNIGKSYTAKRLAEHYKLDLVEVDKIIWGRLGFDSMDDFADWQGQPYEDGYRAREKELIDLEAEATKKAVDNSDAGQILVQTATGIPPSIPLSVVWGVL